MPSPDYFAFALALARLEWRGDVIQQGSQVVALDPQGVRGAADPFGGVSDGESVEPRLEQVIHAGSVRDATR